ncbi:MAG TPA: hypothetical protein VF727_04870 [Allosphingosinicella sp.]|jgi:hypothetical protein
MGKKRTRLPVDRPPVPEFTPVPRRYRHDGWTPERQKAFIAALADTGCVDRAAAMVNIAQTNCYELRRATGAESFRRAREAALSFGVKRLKDVAFQWAVEGQLVPVFSGGKLMGFRRIYNDKLLIFCLRHYGEDASGKRTTINYFSTQAGAAAAAGAPPPPSAVPLPEQAGGGVAEASTTTVRTVIVGSGTAGDGGSGLDDAAAVLNGFEGVVLDAEAQAAIQAALEACAARAREARAAYDAGGEAAADGAEDDPETPFVRLPHLRNPCRGALVPPVRIEEFVPFVPGEGHWTDAGAEMSPDFAARVAAVEAMRAGANAAPEPRTAGPAVKRTAGVRRR